MRLCLLSSLLAAVVAAGCVPDAPPPPDAAPQRPAPRLSACFADATCRAPLVVAHRGEGGSTPENTVASIRELAALGADALEIDVRDTVDGVPVLMHDSTATRTTNQAALFPDRAGIDELTLAEVKTLIVDDPGCTPENADVDPERCRVPTLAEALAAAVDTCILMLDIKSTDAARTAQLLVDADALDVAWAFDSDEATLDAFEAAGVLTMPRAADLATTEDLITRRAPPAVHIDPDYQSEAAAFADAHQTKVLVNLFTTVDFGLATGPLTGDEAIVEEAQRQLEDTLDAGVDLVQTNFAPGVRAWVDEWRAARPSPGP